MALPRSATTSILRSATKIPSRASSSATPSLIRLRPATSLSPCRRQLIISSSTHLSCRSFATVTDTPPPTPPVAETHANETEPVEAEESAEEEDLERATDEVDVCIVGGGPAGLSAAIRLKQLEKEKGREIRVVVLEKGGEVGMSPLFIRPRFVGPFEADEEDGRALAEGCVNL